MANKRLRYLTFVLCFSMLGLNAVQRVDWNAAGITTVATANSFYADASGTNEVYIADTVTFQNNAWIDASAGDVNVFIGERYNGGAYNQVGLAVLQPNLNVGGNLIFHAPTNRKIDIWIPATYTLQSQSNTLDMNITFSGDGQTKFHIGGMDADITSALYGWGTVNFFATHIWVTMDQTQAQAETNHENKLVFQRGCYLGSHVWENMDHDAGDYDSTTSGWPVVIELRENSDFLFVSPEDNSAPIYVPLSDAAVAFDPSNAGKGPFEFLLSDSSGFVIAGHWMDPTNFLQPTLTPTAAVDMRYAAGHNAIVRTIDDLAAAALIGYTPSAATRRGLLIINENEQPPLLYSDPYSFIDLGKSSVFSFPWPNYRKGFILGLNGTFDVYNNRFVHYMSHPEENLPAYDAQAAAGITATFGVNPLIYLKKKNPSAFIVDGLNQFTVEWYGVGITPYPFPFENYDAQMLFRGDGSLHMASAVGVGRNEYPFGFPFDFYPDTDLNYFFSGISGGNNMLAPNAVPNAIYNGDWVALSTSLTMSGEGVHVLDVEGELKAMSSTDSPNIGAVAKAGVVNVAPISLDYKGVEAEYLWNAFTARYDVSGIARPLVLASMVPVYRSSSMLFNDVASFYDIEIKHNDVLKRVIDRPVYCEPGIVGGDRKTYWEGLLGYGTSSWPPVEFPELRLYNSTLSLHESLSPSGVRFVVKQNYETSVAASGQDNYSTILFYNHGDDHDMQWRGFARAFVLGNPHNYMADNLPNRVTESCYFDIFRSRNLPIDGFGNPIDTEIYLGLSQEDEVNIRNMGDKRAGTHLFLFTQGPVGRSCMSLGSTSTRGYDEAALADIPTGYSAWRKQWYPMPWTPYEYVSLIAPKPSNAGVDIDVSDVVKGLPINHATSVSPATLSIDGDISYPWYQDTWIYFGARKYNYFVADADQPYWARDWKAIEDPYKVRFPVIYPYASPVLYVNHGGEVRIIYYEDCIFDTVIATRLWYDYLSTNWQSTPQDQRYTILSGIVNIPHDQILFTEVGSVQPYGYQEAITEASAQTGGMVRLVGYNTDRSLLFDQASNEELTIDWAHRPVDYNQAPIKKLPTRKFARGAVVTRATNPAEGPQDMPADLLYVGQGDHITQLRVAGSTMADPFHIFVTGDENANPFAGIIDEIVSVKTKNLETLPMFWDYYALEASINYQQPTYGSIPGEGGHGVIILSGSGRVGLGNRNWNEHSVNAWNKLGRDYVTIVPFGDGYITLNDDLLVADPLAIIPAKGFGEVRSEGVLVEGSSQRLTFYSENDHEIIVPEFGMLDLRAFGRRTNVEETTAIRQEIAFGGKTKLVLKRGATIRFPHYVDDGVTVVLYFNDESQLVFDGSGEYGKNRFTNFADADAKKIKLMGKGQIWGNKDAKIIVDNDAWVAVRSDYQNPDTDLTISLQRQGSMELGTDQIAGGGFEIGNIYNSYSAYSVKFALALNGPYSEFHIDREGFLGFGVGIINKSDNPNGDASAALNPSGYVPATGLYTFNPDVLNSWQIAPLFDVTNITVDLTRGAFDHSNIF
ncbi:MAG: hypothetical protein ABIA74_01615, partial [bacterium]